MSILSKNQHKGIGIENTLNRSKSLDGTFTSSVIFNINLEETDVISQLMK
jgi:hypothetical protein